MYKLLIQNARQVVKICDNKEKCLFGNKLKSIVLLETENVAEGFSLVVDEYGKIAAIGPNAEVMKNFASCEFKLKLDATGKCVLPGLVDSHTHPVWVGDRVHEFAMKLAGATYMDIHKAGGGIHFTVGHVRQASEDELYQSFISRLKRMSRCGTTTVEVKSGYGLDAENEIKMLRVIERARREFKAVEISSTYCGAHAVPKGKTVDEAVDDVINVQIPKIKSLNDSGELHVENIDVFCEKGVFDREATKRILEAGVAAGMAINFHGDELHPMLSAELGASLGARAISHLEEVSEAGIAAMAERSVVAVLLPTTAYILRLKPPPAREMIDRGVAVALGTDFNPNAYCLSMPMVMHLACCTMRMSMMEALAASTINAAASIGRADSHGSLEVGKQADILILNTPRWEHLIYQMAGHDEIIDCVIKAGEVVYSRT